MLTDAHTDGCVDYHERKTRERERERRCLAVQSRSNIQHHTWVRAGAPSASASFPVLQTGLDPGLIGGIKDLLYNTLVNLHTGKKKDFY